MLQHYTYVGQKSVFVLIWLVPRWFQQKWNLDALVYSCMLVFSLSVNTLPFVCATKMLFIFHHKSWYHKAIKGTSPLIHAAKMVKACTTTILHGFDRWYASVFAQLTIEIGFGIGNRTHTTRKVMLMFSIRFSRLWFYMWSIMYTVHIKNRRRAHAWVCNVHAECSHNCQSDLLAEHAKHGIVLQRCTNSISIF